MRSASLVNQYHNSSHKQHLKRKVACWRRTAASR